jgi:hypothetical protein
MANLLDSHFRKTKIDTTQEIQFDPDMLKLLMAVDERKTLRQIAAEASLRPEVFKQCFTKLVRLRLIEEAEDKRDFLDPGFIDRIKAKLVALVGPLGELLIEDAAGELAVPLHRIPKSDAADLVYRIAQKIPGEKEQNVFKKAMLEEIRTLER